MIKASILFIAIALIGCGLSLETGAAQNKRNRGFSITTGSDKAITDCSQVKVRAHDAEMAQSQQTRTLARSAVPFLQVQAPLNGGIHVQGWDRNEYSISACLTAAGDSDAEAQALLAQLSLSIQDGRVLVQGPIKENWIAYLIIQAPNGTTMSLEATNGPIGLNAISGTIEVRTINGPISLNDVTGQVRAHAQNGPINVEGSGGDFRLNAQNGPIGIELVGSRWETGELEASTQNGPLSLTLPPSYQSSVRIQASKHSPVDCRAIQCKQTARTWDKPHLIEFGDSNPIVRLSTVNGPVTVTSSGDK